jgi:ABC-type nitrate/sulfonate/bicarbonate transport system substrate-binding protein
MSHDPARLRVNVFPGGFNWPLFVANDLGLFQRYGIAIEIQSTTGSVAQMTDFAAGRFDIAMTAFDNIVAYVEGQGEAPIGAQPDFCAFLGSDTSFLSLVGLAEVADCAGLRGRSVSVDAATTGYAFVLFDMLARAGLAAGDYAVAKVGGMVQRFDDLHRGGHAATMLSAPYDLLAQQAGLRVLARLDGPYQGNVAAARRSWAENHAEELAAFVRGYVAAVGWLYDRGNAKEACRILVRNVRGMAPELATASYPVLLDHVRGFFRDGQIQQDGAQAVLDLRARYGPGSARLRSPQAYIDLRYWALAQQ